VSSSADDPYAIREANAELLSLALIDARNLTLRWLEVFEMRGAEADGEGGRSALWLAGHAGWYQERWIARHVQRARGEHAAAREALREAREVLRTEPPPSAQLSPATSAHDRTAPRSPTSP